MARLAFLLVACLLLHPSRVSAQAVSASLVAGVRVVEGQRLAMQQLGAPRLVARSSSHEEYALTLRVTANVGWALSVAAPSRAALEVATTDDGVWIPLAAGGRRVVLAAGDTSGEVELRWRVLRGGHAAPLAAPLAVLTPTDAQSRR